MAHLRVTVCQLHSSSGRLDEDWQGLVEHVAAERADLVLLPEMVFSPWFAASRDVDPQVWSDAVATHVAWRDRLPELSGAAVLGSRPVESAHGRRNSGYVADRRGVQDVHTKSYLPDEEGFWEASWYVAGGGEFAPAAVETRMGPVSAGFMICTEMWFMQHAREYGQRGVQLVVTPRCTPTETLDKWLAGGRAAATVAGAYSLSSNHADPQFGGQGWVIDPDGCVLTVTTAAAPFTTVDIDLGVADASKRTYPRYVPDVIIGR